MIDARAVAGPRRRPGRGHLRGMGGGQGARRAALCPVWQESFTRRAGFPQDHPLFAGHLPWRRELMRDALAPHDLAIAIGTNAFRLYLFDDPGPMVAEGTRVAVLTDDAAEAHRSPCELAVVAPVAAACTALAEQVIAARRASPRRPFARPPAAPPPAAGERLTPGPRVRRARRAPAARRGRRRGDAVEPARALPAPADPLAGRLRRVAATAVSGSASRARSGCGWETRTDRSSA